MSETQNLPAIAPDAAVVVRIKSEIDISDRSRLVTFGDRAQRSVVEFADRVLAQTQNHELGNTGQLLSEILGKARGLDAASLKDANFVTRLFSSVEGRLRRFKEQFDDVASQIDRITVALDRNKETLRRDMRCLMSCTKRPNRRSPTSTLILRRAKPSPRSFARAGSPSWSALPRRRVQGVTHYSRHRPTKTQSRLLIGSKSASSTWSRRARSASNSCRKSVSFSRATRR
jgi:Toxic anion resistance protein (TelA)